MKLGSMRNKLPETLLKDAQTAPEDGEGMDLEGLGEEGDMLPEEEAAPEVDLATISDEQLMDEVKKRGLV